MYDPRSGLGEFIFEIHFTMGQSRSVSLIYPMLYGKWGRENHIYHVELLGETARLSSIFQTFLVIRVPRAMHVPYASFPGREEIPSNFDSLKSDLGRPQIPFWILKVT